MVLTMVIPKQGATNPNHVPYGSQAGYRPIWAFGRIANRGYGSADDNCKRISLTSIRYDTYKCLHLLAHKLSMVSGKRVPLNNALHEAVATMLRSMDGS